MNVMGLICVGPGRVSFVLGPEGCEGECEELDIKEELRS